nr:carboxymuconolactone decarboxylase family protein [Kibdelosporangium phytohabitans]
MRRSLETVRFVTPVKFWSSKGLARSVYRDVEQNFGMLAPPVALHSPAPEVMAASWLLLRETMVASWRASRSAKEVVASVVSVNNTCPYCVAVHGATLNGLLRDPTAIAIAEHRFDEIPDPDLLAIGNWVRTGKSPQAPPLPLDQAPELIGVAVTFEYYNRMVNVFLDESPLPSHVPARMRGTMMRLLSVLMRGPATRHHEPGASLDLLPGPAPDPGGLEWAGGAPHIAEAFARATAVINAAGERSVPDSVRQLVTERLAGWNGEPMGLTREWLTDAEAVLPPEARPAGRIALLTAFASHQVTQADVDGFRGVHADDRRLVEVAAWAGLAAARHRLAPIAASYRSGSGS